MSEAAAADAVPEEEAAEGAAPAGSLMDHLFQRIGQHKEKVILGFAYATCDVIATNYLTSGTYPIGDNYFAAIRRRRRRPRRRRPLRPLQRRR